MTTLALLDHRPDLVLNIEKESQRFILSKARSEPHVKNTSVRKTQTQTLERNRVKDLFSASSRLYMVTTFCLSIALVVGLITLPAYLSQVVIGVALMLMAAMWGLCLFAFHKYEMAKINIIARRFGALVMNELGMSVPELYFLNSPPRNGVLRIDGSALGRHEGLIVEFVLRSSQIVEERVISLSDPKALWDETFSRLEESYSPVVIRQNEKVVAKAAKRAKKADRLSAQDVAVNTFAALSGIAFGSLLVMVLPESWLGSDD